MVTFSNVKSPSPIPLPANNDVIFGELIFAPVLLTEILLILVYDEPITSLASFISYSSV